MPGIIALDYGERRIGVAVSDEDGIIAMPLCIVHVRSRRQAASEIQRICRDKKAAKVVVGMPLNMDGSRGAQAERASEFAGQLEDLLDIPVETWDERLSTRIAERVLIDSDMSRVKRKRVMDKLAAQVMLQGYLDAQACNRNPDP